MKVALVHDWLTTLGGSERVLLALTRLFPGAPVFTSVYDPERLPSEFHALDVRPSFLQRLPGAKRHHQALLPLMPLAFEQHDLRGFDLVVSSHHACAKGVIPMAEALHVAYVHTPMRYAWDLTHEYQATLSRPARILAAPLLHYLRTWDQTASLRVDHFIANSREVAGRIEKHYRREAAVVHPPIATARFANTQSPGEHDLVVSRLVPYKRVDLAIAAANQTGRKLRVVGDGPMYQQLRGQAGKTVEFLGHLSDAEVAEQYAACRCLLFPGYEDFGITPLEAMASGRPVVAYGRGGATETVADGLTGILFAEQSVECLVSALRRLDALEVSPDALIRHAAMSDEAIFLKTLSNLIQGYWDVRQTLGEPVERSA